MVVWLPLLLALLGALVYGLSANPKVAELARILYAAALFALAFAYASRTVHVF